MRLLEGVTVIDFTQAYSGPFCTLNLADMGARVIKIERAGVGDQSREWGPFAEDGGSGYFASINRGKEGFSLNIATEEGLEIARKLIEKADILVENFKVGTLDRKGLGYEDVKKINPGIIYASISGYGQNGPWTGLAAYDNVVQAQAGLMDTTGYPDGVPTRIGVSVGDNYTGLNLATSIAMAYFHKMRTGEGQRVEVAMWDTLFAIQEEPILYKTMLDEVLPRSGNHHRHVYPSDMFDCKDGYFTVSVQTGSPEEWKAFCEAIGNPGLAAEEKYDTNEKRLAAYEELTALIAPFFADKTAEELNAIFDAAGIAGSPVYELHQLSHNPHLEAREMVKPVTDKIVGRHRAVGNPMKIEGAMPEIAESAPLLAQDTPSILRELGYNDEQIQDFTERGIV